MTKFIVFSKSVFRNPLSFIRRESYCFPKQYNRLAVEKKIWRELENLGTESLNTT